MLLAFYLVLFTSWNRDQQFILFIDRINSYPDVKETQTLRLSILIGSLLGVGRTWDGFYLIRPSERAIRYLENGRSSSFLCADAVSCCLKGTDSRGRGVRDVSQRAMANREAAICFSFRPSMTPVTQLRPVFVSCQKDEGFELIHLYKKNSSTQELTVPEEGEWDLDDLGGLSDWLKAYGFTAEVFPARLECAKCNFWTLFGLQRFIKEKKMEKKKKKEEEFDFCIDC